MVPPMNFYSSVPYKIVNIQEITNSFHFIPHRNLWSMKLQSFNET